MPYLLKEGIGTPKAAYTRCEDELLCRAELLLLREKHENDPAGLLGYYDVDPTLTIAEFKRSYRGRSDDYKRLMELRQQIIKEGWPYEEIVPPS